MNPICPECGFRFAAIRRPDCETHDLYWDSFDNALKDYPEPSWLAEEYPVGESA